MLQRSIELLSADLTACCTAALRRTRCLLQMQLLLTFVQRREAYGRCIQIPATSARDTKANSNQDSQPP